MLRRKYTLPPGQRDIGISSSAQAARPRAIRSSRGRIVKGCPRVNRSRRWVAIARIAAISAIRTEASAGTNDCGARNMMRMKTMRAQNGTELAGVEGRVADALPRGE